MNLFELIREQQLGYAQFHADRTNLRLHLLTAPVFQLAHLGLLVSLGQGHWGAALAWVGLALFAIAIQGRGHAMEARPALPFTGPLNALLRIEAEQWITFPRYALSGGWRLAFART
ncbi:terminase [Pelomonas sp. SE-A7]|uniref:terminase n=1 Tax=Pelomonas sp. SE-A7 TaxID=3054953 RepID=UPI00259D1D03|nr:terminase [Pelomonas sp. SE-A7]MDM4766451.1 terminase [Pelomonas sp. SE-A7]